MIYKIFPAKFVDRHTDHLIPNFILSHIINKY
jgi:hypothetical protein